MLGERVVVLKWGYLEVFGERVVVLRWGYLEVLGERVRLQLVVLLVEHGEEARRGREKRYCRRLHHGRGRHVGFGARAASQRWLLLL